MEETIFEKIVAGEIPADKVYETDETLAFLSIEPINKGHTLLIPKKVVKDITELEEKEGHALIQALPKIARAVKKATGAPGVNIFVNNGAEAGQEVFHLHFHVIPRFSRDEFPSIPHASYENDEEKKKCAEDIQNAITH